MAAEMSPSPTIGTHAARLAAAHVGGRLWKESDSGLVYRDNGATWDLWVPYGSKVKSADTTVATNASFSFDSDLAIPIEPNEIWTMKLFLFLNSVSITPDWQYGFDFTAAGLTAMWNPVGDAGAQNNGGWAGRGVANGVNRVLGMADVATQASIAGNTLSIMVVGRFVNGANAGTLRLKIAQNTATAEVDKLLAGSWAEVMRQA